jgi:hypothetical protein
MAGAACGRVDKTFKRTWLQHLTIEISLELVVQILLLCSAGQTASGKAFVKLSYSVKE